MEASSMPAAECVRVRALLAFSRACRRVHRFEEPTDINTAEYEDDYYVAELRNGRKFLDRFPPLGGQRVLEIGCGFGGLLAALEQRGSEAVGIDIDQRRADYVRSRGHTAEVADAAELPFPDASFDVIVTDSVIEHLPDLFGSLREARRVLRPGGTLYGVWGPSWLTYNGPHLVKCLGIPWVHLIFSDRTIFAALEHQKRTGEWPASYLDYKIEDFQAMGRNTRRKLRSAARSAGFKILTERSRSPKTAKRALSRLPLLDELLAGELEVMLRG
jgi:SAM-dependent methyltransferase